MSKIFTVNIIIELYSPAICQIRSVVGDLVSGATKGDYQHLPIELMQLYRGLSPVRH